MAILSNINGKFAVDSTGAVQFSGAAGTSGYILKSNGTGSAPTWVDPSTVIGGPYLPLSGGTLTGATATASGISFTVGGTLTGTTATFSGDVNVEDNLYLTDAGTVRGKIQLNSSDRDNLDIKAISLGSLMRFYTVDTLALTLDASQNATFTGANTYNKIQSFYSGDYTSGWKFSDYNGGIWYDAGADDLYLNANHANSQIILQSGGSTTLTLDASNNATFASDVYVTGTTNSNVVISRDNMYLDAGQFYIGADDSVTDDSFRQRTASGSYFIESRKSGTWTNRLQINSAGTLIVGQGATFTGKITAQEGIEITGGSIAQSTAVLHTNNIIYFRGGSNGLFLQNADGSDGYYISNSDHKWEVNSGESMRLTSTGLGIGTSSPSVKLDTRLSSTTGKVAEFHNSVGYGIGFTVESDGGVNTINSESNQALAFATNGASNERMRITSAGAIEIKGTSTTTNAQAFITNDNSVLSIGSSVSGSVVKDIQFNSPSAMMYIDGSKGSVGIGTTVPDQTGYGYNVLTIMGGTTAGYAGTIELLAPSVNAEGQNYGLLSFGAGGTRTALINAARESANNAANLRFWTSPGSGIVERMRITKDGNVGIGLTSPAVKLEIQDSTHTTMKIRSGNNDNILFAQALQSDEARIGTDTNSAISFFTNTSRRMTITTSGNVGIGTNLPAQKVEIAGGYLKFSGGDYGIQGSASLTYNTVSDHYFQSNGSTKVTFKANGNVGIGITSPTATFQVGGGSANVLQKIWGSGTAGIQIFTNSPSTGTKIIALEQYFSNEGYLGLYYNGVEKVRFRSNDSSFFNGGNLGIGTTSPSTPLQVHGQQKWYTTSVDGNELRGFFNPGGSGDDAELSVYKADGATEGVVWRGTGNSYIRIDSTSLKFINFYYGISNVGQIVTGGSNVLYQSNSDYRLKENVVEMTGALDRVSELKPSRYNFISHPGEQVDGFMAHELQEIVPQAVSGEKDEINEDGTPKYQGVDHSQIVPLLVGAIQELEARVKELENK